MNGLLEVFFGQFLPLFAGACLELVGAFLPIQPYDTSDSMPYWKQN